MNTKDKLLAAARKCLLELGYARTTVRDLVAASGANQAAINYHFGSKEKLLVTALNQLNTTWGELLFTALTGPDGADGTAGKRTRASKVDHEALWERIIASIQENRALWFVNFESVASARHDDQIKDMIAEGQVASRTSLARAFAGLAEDDDAETVHAVGSHYHALLVGVAVQWLTAPDHAPSARQIAAADAHAPARS